MAALEGGGVGVAFSSGAAAVLMVMMTLARAGSNIVCTESLHGGTYHQFKTFLPSIGIEARFIKDGYTTHDIQALIDENTKLVFAETIGNPRFTVVDFETLSTVAHTNGLPLIVRLICILQSHYTLTRICIQVDSTFAAGGYFCRPFDHGADIIIHSTTKWIAGHGTSVGGVVIDNSQIDWLKSSTRYPQFHGGRAGTGDLNLYQTYGRKAFSVFLKFEVLRDTGACMGARAAHDMLMGLETLSVRCERQAANTRAVAEWLRSRPDIKWIQYLGFEEHESHSLARKYLTRGYGTVLTFGLKGGQNAALAFVARLRLIKNTAK
jgi:O-acetylhomoserine/O-acetylserine sulfhydrylase